MKTHSTYNADFRNYHKETAGYWILRHVQTEARLRRVLKLAKEYRQQVKELEEEINQLEEDLSWGTGCFDSWHCGEEQW